MPEKARPREPSASALVAAGLMPGTPALAWVGTRPHAAPGGDAPIVTWADLRPGPVAAAGGFSPGGRPTRIIVPAADGDVPFQEAGVTFEAGRAVWDLTLAASPPDLKNRLVVIGTLAS